MRLTFRVRFLLAVRTTVLLSTATKCICSLASVSQRQQLNWVLQSASRLLGALARLCLCRIRGCTCHVWHVEVRRLLRLHLVKRLSQLQLRHEHLAGGAVWTSEVLKRGSNWKCYVPVFFRNASQCLAALVFPKFPRVLLRYESHAKVGSQRQRAFNSIWLRVSCVAGLN